MGRTGAGMRMVEENFSQGTNWSGVYSFFTWKWFQNYRWKNKNTQNTHITFTQIRLLLNICPTCFIMCFLSRVLFLTYVYTLPHLHSTHTHLHPRYTHSDKHMPSFVGVLCGVLFENNKEVSEGLEVQDEEKAKEVLLPDASTILLLLPPSNANSKLSSVLV